MSYTIEPVRTDDQCIATMTALLRQVFPGAAHFTQDVVRWQYRDPEGGAVGFNAWSGTELAAHYVTIPLLARVNGKEERGLLSLNTATHPAHQGKGLFTKLANATYHSATEQGFGFVIGVANTNSTHGFTKKLGFQLVAPLKAMIGVGAFSFKPPVDVQYEHLWSKSALAWRLAHPVYGKRYTAANDDGLRVIFSDRSQGGARLVLAAMDASYPECNANGVRGPKPLLRIWIGLDPGMRWGMKPYINIPMQFRPSPLNLIFKDLTGQGRTLEAEKVRFQAIDFDTL